MVFLPKIRSGEVPHPVLKRPDPTVTFVVQGAMDGLVETARSKIELKASIERLDPTVSLGFSALMARSIS
jgi:hypothetical protein